MLTVSPGSDSIRAGFAHVGEVDRSPEACYGAGPMGKRISVKNRKRRRDLLKAEKTGKARKRNKLSVRQSNAEKKRKANRWN